MSARSDSGGTGADTAGCSPVLWDPGLPLLSSELQNGLHGVQASGAKVGDVALHADGFQPLRDRSIGDPI